MKQLGEIGDHKCPKEIALGLQNCADELTKWNNVVFAHIPKKNPGKKKDSIFLLSRKKDGFYGVDINML